MKTLIHKFLFLYFVVFGILSVSQAESVEEKVIYNFSQNWLRYDKYYESYLPIKNDALRNSKSIHQIIQIEKYRECELSFVASQGLSFFVNDKLIYKKITDVEEVVHIPLTSIKNDNRGEVIITFYHSMSKLPFYTTSITRKVVVNNKISEDNPNFVVLAKSNNNLSGFFILFLLIAFVFVLFKQMYPKEYVRYYSFKFQESSDHLLPGTFSVPSIVMGLINALIVALLIYMLKLDEVIFNSSYSLFKGTLYIVFFYAMFFIGKYFYISGIAWLFNYSKIVALQFTEYIRFMEICFLFAAFIVFGIEASGFIKLSLRPEILYYSLIIVLIICVVKVIFLFFRLISHRNLYLFSYICAAEILPLIIAVKILLF